jgi:hypothetical protein
MGLGLLGRFLHAAYEGDHRTLKLELEQRASERLRARIFDAPGGEETARAEDGRRAVVRVCLVDAPRAVAEL